ncbi:MAG: hypothetical protein CM15mP77_1010 [Synechococcus sp.]|nr:MAG: hypothetical protein CM15mP77_1010 [Synechococcus sp.]
MARGFLVCLTVSNLGISYPNPAPLLRFCHGRSLKFTVVGPAPLFWGVVTLCLGTQSLGLMFPPGLERMAQRWREGCKVEVGGGFVPNRQKLISSSTETQSGNPFFRLLCIPAFWR